VGGCAPQVLETLIEYGLLTRSGERAYGLHPLVRYLVAEELARYPDEQAQAALRHVGHFTRFVASVSEHVARDANAIYDLIDHWSDLNLAWGWAVARRNREYIARLRPGRLPGGRRAVLAGGGGPGRDGCAAYAEPRRWLGDH
jgi:hypothetical protein